MPSRPQTSAEIRQDFLDFFREKGHEIVPSDSLVPHDDPTLLFTNAGMNQFKDVFLGTGSRPYRRAADTQKCLRVSGKHNDLEEVGLDTYHHTFFEMLGNWSFGDYFKKEAIAWAWELLVDRWGLDPDRLYVSVHEGDEALGLDPDEEAADLWWGETSIPRDHVLFQPTADNFWMMGETGPCGPCSEIHYDARSDEERASEPGADLVNTGHPQVIEVWNLVFIQFNALRATGEEGSTTVLEPLSAKHVDTGMGFERICSVIQGKRSNYDSDVFTPLLTAISELAPDRLKPYDDAEERTQIAMRVVADHIRTLAFAIADGAAPSNTGRGYVIRRILRRAVRYGYQALGFEQPFLYRLVPTLVDEMGDVFPEIRERQSTIERTIRAEEEGFLRTLATGVAMFDEVVAALVAGDTFPGDVAFLLHDTYGFPIDLTELMAREEGLTVDREHFDKLMEEQRTRARAAGTFKVDQSHVDTWQPTVDAGTDNGESIRFVGYDAMRVEGARILRTRMTGDGDRAELVLDATPFYAESGGQIGDTGTLQVDDEEITVLNTVKDAKGTIIHVVDRIPEARGTTVVAEVDPDRRRRIMRHHTATHLLHVALRTILGDHVEQRGSLVAPDRLRFDFAHFERVTPEQLREVEHLVNRFVMANAPLEEERALPISEARARGAMALFGEKYGEVVRMISFTSPNHDLPDSIELCGGTHVAATGEVGPFRITTEGSVASGIRRIEAVAGEVAVEWTNERLEELGEARAAFRQVPGTLAEAIAGLQEENKTLSKELAQFRAQQIAANLDSYLENATEIESADGLRLRVVTEHVGDAGMDALRDLAQNARDRMGDAAVAVFGAADPEGDKAYIACAVSDDLIKQGLQAGKLVGTLAKRIGGGGGGRPQLATAGGRHPERVGEALAAVVDEIRAGLAG